MSGLDAAAEELTGGYGLLDRARTVAGPGFNRWLVPPAALAIHLCIGMAYGFSVFWLPLSRAIGVQRPLACAEPGLWNALFTTSCDWRVSDLVWTFTLFIVVLGLAAALWGEWLERAGPRKAGVVAALCWCGGMGISAGGIALHQLWIIWLGSGVIGGIGLGLGYISPVSTLIKWFPDRRGMATGMAIMGFGGGAMIGAPLANLLINHFHTDSAVGVWQTFLVLACVYFVYMMAGAFGYRVPPRDWVLNPGTRAVAATRHVHLRNAHRTLQFWLLWAVLCLNVSAGIGVLAVASPMLQQIFGGSLIGHPDLGLAQLDDPQRRLVASVAAGFAGLLSLFNILGRFFWASLSDRLGRRTTFATFFALGFTLYALAPQAAHSGSKALFALDLCIILSMYGGGFATVPAYLADIFGTQFVGAIHGRLLTAWSTAGVIGPLLVTTISQAGASQGVSGARLYDLTLYVLSGLLVLGFAANLLIRPLPERWFMSPADIAALSPQRSEPRRTAPSAAARGGMGVIAVLAWLAVGIPLAWGFYRTISGALVLFG